MQTNQVREDTLLTRIIVMDQKSSGVLVTPAISSWTNKKYWKPQESGKEMWHSSVPILIERGSLHVP